MYCIEYFEASKFAFGLVLCLDSETVSLVKPLTSMGPSCFLYVLFVWHN